MNIKKLFPIIEWVTTYQRSYLAGDISAGLTVGVMLIPQGMAYAMIAGLPPVYGLYAAMIPQLVYAIFGTSRQLAVGPVAMDSLLVAAGVSTMAAVGSENYIALAVFLSLMMGVVQLAFGALRLGFLVNFLSKPVISGFTSAAAIIIGMNQLRHLLGFEIEQGNNIFAIIQEAVLNIASVNHVTLIIGVLGIILIKAVKKIHKSIPGALVVVVLGIIAVQFLGLDAMGVQIVGEVPKGLPPFEMPRLEIAQINELVPMALTLALIAFMEAISVAKALQTKHKGEYELDNNQEMTSLGLGNIVGSFFACYPTTGGFGRSAVNEEAGAKTNLAAIISALLVGLTLMFLTPLFFYLPKAILGAIIMVAVFGLIDFKYPKYLWSISKQDFLMFAVAFGFTLILGIKEGIGAGVLISLLMLIYRTTKPHIAVLGELPGTKDYRNVDRFEVIHVREDVLVMRHDAQLYFANIRNFIDTLKESIDAKGASLKLVVLHCGSISSIDATAIQSLEELIEELNHRNIGVYFSGIIEPVRDFLQCTGFVQLVGENHFFIDVPSAIEYLDHGARKHSKQQLSSAIKNNVFREKEV